MPAELRSTSHGATMVLTISHPEQGNAIGPDIHAAAVEALNVAETLPEVRSVIITGEGATFCEGDALQDLLELRRHPPEAQAQHLEGLHNWIEAIRTFPKPVIAAVEGTAAGTGFALALGCDLLVAADNATFVMAHANLGLSPVGGVSWSLTRVMPRQLAGELLLAGERIGAPRLHALGIVNRLGAPGAALSEALALAEHLNAKAAHALASIKELMNEAPEASLSGQLAQERNHFITNLHHRDAGIGIEAALAKKTPRYE